MSNFAFVRAEWPALFTEAARAERLAYADSRVACFYARRALEATLTWLYDVDGTLRTPYKDDLSAMLFEPTLRSLVGPALHTKMDLIRRQGNAAVHRSTPVKPDDALAVVRELFHVLAWLALRYSRHSGADSTAQQRFDEGLVPRPPSVQDRLTSQSEVKALAEQLNEKDAALAAERATAVDRDAEIAALRKEIAAAKRANEDRPDDHDYDEATTRDRYLDVMLKEVGWALDQARDREYEVTGMPNAQGKGFVDYVLWGDDGKPLAVVEAKRTRRDAVAGQQQARLYADCLERQFGQRPVIFYTNGYDTWLWDDTHYPPRQVQGFYSRDEVALHVQRRASRRPLAELEIDRRIVERHYQQRAIRRVAETFEQDRTRAALVVMATGAGKTRTVIALADLLMRANWVKRVLFLADRVALVNQTVNAFKQHLPNVATVNLVTNRNADGRVFVSTYPTMMGLIDKGAGDARRFGPGYFDLVVVDEAHRSVYQKYRAIFAYFDSLLVGLTATPRDEVDRNTYGLFHLEDGVPTDAYELAEAVADGFLVPGRAVSVPLKFQREGITYADLSEAEKDQWDLTEWDDDGSVPDSVAADAVNRWLFNEDTVDKVLATLMTEGHHVAGSDRLGKTIIFAKNNQHADFITQRFDANYPELAGAFARTITYRTEYAQSLIDDFAQKDRAPHIAVSVDMLDTGIDIPEVVNLVFFKIVRSKTKFWQMIGRGTRLCEDLYGPGEHKTDFRIFDFCGNLEFFEHDPATSDGRLAESLAERLFKARLELLTTLEPRRGAEHVTGDSDGDDGTRTEVGLRIETARHLNELVKGMNVDNFVVRPHRELVEIYVDLAPWHVLGPDEAAQVGDRLAGLPTTVRDDDELAKRFDLLVLRLQLAQLQAGVSFTRLREQVQEIAAALLEQTNIPAVREQQELLDDVAGDEWWVDVTVPMLELVRRRMRLLVKLIERSRRTIVYTDFVDVIGEQRDVELSRFGPGLGFERFRAKVAAYLREHQDHVSVQRLRRNQQLTTSDLDELERILADSGAGGPEEIEEARQSADGLGLFVRSLVGLDRAAAIEAFADFISGRKLRANQIQFVDLIIEHLTRNGVMEAARLYESPLTDVAPLGPESLFAGSDIDALIDVLHAVRRTAAPEHAVA